MPDSGWAELGVARGGKDRRSGDRGSGRRSGPGPDEQGDEDYDWIKYLGEGRAAPSSPSSGSSSASPPFSSVVDRRQSRPLGGPRAGAGRERPELPVPPAPAPSLAPPPAPAPGRGPPSD